MEHVYSEWTKAEFEGSDLPYTNLIYIRYIHTLNNFVGNTLLHYIALLTTEKKETPKSEVSSLESCF